MNMRLLTLPLAILCFGLLPSKTPAQSVTVDLLFEDFESGTFPPDGWYHFVNGSSTRGWGTGSKLRGTAAFHDDHLNSNDNLLVTPPMSFFAYSGGQAWLHFLQSTAFASFRDYHLVEVSLDGGATFQTIWNDTGADAAFASVDLDLSAYAGMTGVIIAFRYIGDNADQWWVDEVKINDISGNVIEIANNPANGHSYYLLAPSSWTEAQTAAQELGGNLVTIDDSAEHVWIVDNFGTDLWGNNRAIWIGLNDKTTEGVFEWIDGSTSTYTAWGQNEPNGNTAGEDHGYLIPHDQYLMGDLINIEYGSGNGGALYGLVEKASPMPIYSIANLTSPGTATMTIENCEATDKAMVGYSLSGSGPSTTAFGNVDMSPPIQRIGPFVPNAAGDIIKNINIPIGLSGATLWTQTLVIKSSGSSILTNSLAIPFP